MRPNEALKAKIDLLPESPGVYIYYNKAGDIIYIGKAKKLRRRVKSYFNKEHKVLRTNLLVRNIADLRYIVVDTEEDALHLENALIKENKPHYNVLLKDDKSYPWICVTNEPYPRVLITRDPKKSMGKLYGPYANTAMVRTVLDLIKELYPIRTCNRVITPDSIEKGKYKVCLQYHLKNCLGCCVGNVSIEDYGEMIANVKRILIGDTRTLSDHLMQQMADLSEQLRFEEAQLLKEKYLLIEKYRAKTVIVNAQIHDVDVYSFIRDDNAVFINYMHINSGSITKSITLEYRPKLGETDAYLLSMAIGEIQLKLESRVKEIIVPFEPDMEFNGVTFTIPQRGDKKKLLEISEKNARQYRIDKLKQAEKINPEQRVMRTLTTMQKDLRMSVLPRHIECFDNSNIQGTNPVASCVVFKNARPSKRDYRHFNIKTVVGPDDFASMIEVLTRRYSRLVEENQELPQLIIVDGGKGQLSAAVEALENLGLRGKIAVIGIAKRLEEIYFPGDSIPLYIDKNSETLKVIQHLRDEAHRFGITHHRNRRSKGQLSSELDGIKGIGPQTRETLLKHFKSLKRIKEATLDEISDVIGKSKGLTLWKAFHEKEIKII